jgi:hypothetical protein
LRLGYFEQASTGNIRQPCIYQLGFLQMFLQIKQILEINMNLGLNTDPYHSPLMALSIAPLFRKSRTT